MGPCALHRMRVGVLTVCLGLAGAVLLGPASAVLPGRQGGTTGLDDLLRAADIVVGNAALDTAIRDGATLTDRRAALADRDVQAALKLLRQGFSKRLELPPIGDYMPLFPKLRQLARLLAVEQYVLWADGKTSQALDNLRDVLLLGHLTQQCALIGNTVGIAIDSMGIGTARDHLGQLSASDCEKLRKLAESWLDLPDPAFTALEREKRVYAEQLPEGPTRAEVAALLAARLDSVAAVLKKPAWERRLPTFETGGSPAEATAKEIWSSLEPVLVGIMHSWATEMAKVQLLGVHAAILRHLWEHAAVPETLEELNLGRLAVDPFSGRPFSYRKTGRRTYELSSIGPPERDEEGRYTGTRRPLTLETPR